MKTIYELFENGFNFSNALYCDYPSVPKEYKVFEHFIDDNQKISTNFIGRVTTKKLNEYVAEMKEQNKILKKFSKTKLYVTSFVHDGYVISVLLNDVKMSCEYLKNAGWDIVC